jgi:hypothetical protein
MLAIFWLILAYGSFDVFATEENLTWVQNICSKSFFKFSIYEILAVILIVLLAGFKKTNRPVKYSTFFLTCSVLLLVISFFNPYNSLPLQEYLFEEKVFGFYFLIIFFFVIMSIDNETYVDVFNAIASVGLYVLLFASVQADIFYFIGRPNFFLGSYASTIPYMDVLIYLSVFQLLMLIQYLRTFEKKYLVYLMIFLVTLVLSYRRSALYVALVADIFLFLYYYYVTPKKTRATRIILISVCVGAVALVSFSILAPDKYDNFVNRYLGAFSYFSNPSMKDDDIYSDSGHMEQSIITTQVFFDKVGDTFWGGGFGNRPFFVEGQALDNAKNLGGIHNNFVLVWAAWGTHATIYLAILVVLLISIMVKLISTKNQNLTIAGAIIYLLGFLILGWTNGICFISNMQYTFLFIFLFSVIKFLPQHEGEIPQSADNKL